MAMHEAGKPQEPKRTDFLPKGTLSVSQVATFRACQYKWFLQRVVRQEKDADYEEDPSIFALGKAFHHALEMSNHLPEISGDWFIRENDAGMYGLMRMFGIGIWDAVKVSSMLKAYRELHELTGLRVVMNELKIFRDGFGGYIDAIMVDDLNFEWWICDMKTSGWVENNLETRLPLDPQLNAYASMADLVPSLVPGVRGKQFAGCLYRVTTKPRHKPSKKKKETFLDAMNRMDPVATEHRIPIERMDPELIMDGIKTAERNMNSIRNGFMKPDRNVKACTDYNRTCEYWSQCHGWLASEAKSAAIINTIDKLKRQEKVKEFL